jgi:RNA polymerase sigma-70 factor, ECF subfamily
VADDDFETHRRHLFGVAYRLLGSRADAEDAVQEAWLRYAAAHGTEIQEPRAWLTTVVSRICLDVLRSARVRREAYVGSWLPEPLVSRLPAAAGAPAAPGAAGVPAAPAADPAEAAVRREQVSYALLVVLERLAPEQRVALVLHDVFAVPFEEIGAVLGTTAGNARQLASRARRAVHAEPAVAQSTDPAEQRRVLAAFINAAASGDLATLVRALAPDAVLTGDGGGVVPAARRPLEGAEQVAAFLAGLYRQTRRRQVFAELVLVNGDLGFVVETDPIRFVLLPVVRDGRVVAVYSQLNPEKLGGVPALDRTSATWPPTVDLHNGQS